MKKAFLLAVLAVFGQGAAATKIARPALTEMYERSEVVALGRVESGRVLADDCGLEYTFRVKSAFKGTASGALIRFQGSESIQLGSEYYMFLGKTGREFAPLASTNSFDMNRRAAYVARCQGKRPALSVNAFGWGAMKTLPSYDQKSPTEVVVDPMVIISPAVLAKIQLRKGDRYDSDLRFTALDSARFSDYLISLKRRDK